MEELIKRHIIESFRDKYHRSAKKEKGAVLGELMNKLQCHRKHAIRLLKKPNVKERLRVTKPRRGRKSKYDTPEFLKALHQVRRVMEYRNTEVIKENMTEWLPYIERHYGKLPEDINRKLLTISAATMKRYFRRMREQAGTGLSTTRPGSTLRNEIPICTHSHWDELVPGKMATDTVAHCGNTTEGQYICSLDMVDPVTHWCAQRAVWGKGAAGVLEQTKAIEVSLPFKMIGLHVDNGSEFINHHYIRHYTNQPQRSGFSFTRSRAYRKNDNCHVEQKNWSVVRRYLGYDRFTFPELVPLINDLYANELNIYLNHFCRTFKLEKKVAIKSRYRRIYGTPITPYERVLSSKYVTDDVKVLLKNKHAELDPVALKLEIERKLKNIFRLFKQLSTSRSAASLP